MSHTEEPQLPLRAGHRTLRWRAVVHGTVTGLASRGIAVVVSLLSVPLTIGYLGTERFGVWALVGSILTWMRLADIGIGNGLNTAISHAHGSEDPQAIRAHTSTAYVMMTGIAVVVGLVLFLVWPWIDWVSLFGLTGSLAKQQVGPAMGAAAAIFLLSFPLSLSARVYTATQQGRVANGWQAAGNVASLLGLVIVTSTSGGLPWLVVAMSGSILLVDAASTVWLLVLSKRGVKPSLRLVNAASARTVLGTGVQFLLIQVMALVVFESDNFVIAHFLGADHVAGYSVAYKLFNYSVLIQTVLFGYVWVAYTEAMARKDHAWVREVFRRNLRFSMIATAAVVVPLVFLAGPVIDVWTNGHVRPTTTLVLLLAAWNLINAYCSPIACLFAAASHMRAQLIYSLLATVLNIVLSIHLVQIWGVPGVVAATVISYLVLICAPVTVDATLFLRKMP